MRALVAGGAGFLAAVLWFDLMFDVQVRGHAGHDLPIEVRTSVVTYYARVTTAARPMNRLVPVAMATTLGGLVAELVRADLPRWRAGTAFVFAVAAVGLAGIRTVPNAVRLGRGDDTATVQSALARRILADHVLCFCAIAAVLMLQLAPA